jgi:hypothetical protein
MHTDETLKILDQTTISIGTEFRAFANKICPSFDTRELKREAAARRRRQAKGAESSRTTRSTEKHLKEQREEPPQRRIFSLRSYKYHSIGDVSNTIREYGTSDSFSTEPVRIGDAFTSICYSYSFSFRASWSIELQKPDTNEPIREINSSNSLLRLSVVKLDFAAFASEQIFQRPARAQVISWPELLRSTITSVFLKKITYTLVFF